MRAYRLIFLGTVAASVFALRPITASAQSTVVLGLSGGAAVPLGKIKDVYSTGFNGTASLGFGAGETPLSLRFDGTYTKFNNRDVGTTTIVGSRIISGDVNVIVSVLGGEVIRPYFLAGGGIYNLKPLAAKANSSNDFGYQGGAGVAFDFSGFNTFIEARVHHVLTDNGATRYAPIVFGILF
jgi:opacity protein-like surface antigen